jgi:glycosyltransferase involved in cell wall biosynthesis
MEKLSVVIIACNEERNMDRCLKSVFWADEIVVADSGSTDGTVSICERHGCRVFKTPWLGFSRTREFAAAKASHDWILSVDADEEVSDELRDEIRSLLKTAPPFNGYRMPVRSFFLGRRIRHSGWDKESHVRLFRRKFGGYTDRPVHEGVRVEGGEGVLKGILWHYPYPSLQVYIRKMNQYSELGAESLRMRGKTSSPSNALLHGLSKFVKMYVVQRGFLDGREGFTLAFVSAVSVTFKYLKTWKTGE